MKNTKEVKKEIKTFGEYLFNTKNEEILYNICDSLNMLDCRLIDKLDDLLTLKQQDELKFDQDEYDSLLLDLIDHMEDELADKDHDDQIDKLTNTCSMFEISFNNASYLIDFSKEEFIYYLNNIVVNDDIPRSYIFNVVNNGINDRYIKTKIGLTPVNRYRGSDGIINTYIYNVEEYNIKLRVKK